MLSLAAERELKKKKYSNYEGLFLEISLRFNA